ncbi:hypothetical protein [Hwangdonia lutea]|uniref:Lipoprotein n=1 Tax=Hwangdonia lutea TaxID=3075823 RepID=A0AA97EQF3_9FLAO|nr:hypothetical protein [Hwangdonia sp. SCSIO 19198]WOD44689.1 hypothetical protein RNZ46_05370 [Hwangdonia sp. SCSIO 19198]
MSKMLTAFLCIGFLLLACDSENEDVLNQTGIVVNQTSCGGGPEPVFIIKLSENDSIMTATLPKAYQKPNLKIQFKTKEKSSVLICTMDKIYPEHIDVYDVISI